LGWESKFAAPVGCGASSKFKLQDGRSLPRSVEILYKFFCLTQKIEIEILGHLTIYYFYFFSEEYFGISLSKQQVFTQNQDVLLN
jgi:hypothetical protein